MLTKTDSDYLRRLANAAEAILALLARRPAPPVDAEVRPTPTLRPNEWRDIDG